MSWRDITLGALCAEGGGGVQTGPFGSQLHAADYALEGVPSVMPQNIGDNVIDERGIARITTDDAARLEKYLLAEGDIVYSRRGDVEKRALVGAHNEGWLCGTGCLRVRVGDSSRADAKFVSYLLGVPETRAWISRHAVGATMPNLNTKILSSVPLRVPGITEQRAIAELLGALDDKIAANTNLAAKADDLALAVFANLARNATYSSSTFADVAKVSGGGTPSTKVPDYWGGDVLWATPTDITALVGPYLESTSRKITPEGLAACSSDLFAPGAILMTSRATIGAFAVNQLPTAVNQGFIVVEPYDKSLTNWILHDMRSRVDEFVSMANGATFLELSRGNFKKFYNRTADEETMRSFGAYAESLHDVGRHALRENSSLAELRDTLLPELMSGRLRVKDAEKKIEEVV